MVASAAGSAKSGSSRIVRAKRSRARTSSQPRNIARLLVLSLIALALGFMVVRAAAVDALLRKNPFAAARIAPDDPRAQMALARFEFSQKQGAVGPKRFQAALDGLGRAPLAYEPFLLGGVAALLEKDNAPAERMLAEARHRNPRARIPRLLLLDRYLRTGRVEQAAQEITVLTRLVPEANKVLIPELAKFAISPETRPALERVLRSNPEIRGAILYQLATTGADPNLVFGLAGKQAATPPGAEPEPWQAKILDALVARGEVQRARGLWTRLLPAAPPAGQALYDPDFRGLPGPPPFNWLLTSNNAGIAERAKPGALEVEYYGRLPAKLASQLLVLGPGRYRLSFRATGDAPASDESLGWTLTCVPGAQTIATLPIGKTSYAGTPIRGDFAVPAGCAAQRLELIGKPTEFPATTSLSLSQLRLNRVSDK